MKTALVFTHETHEGPALFGDSLQQRGFELQIIYTAQNDIKTLNDNADLLLVMGGPMGVYDSDKYLFLKDEVYFLKRRLAAEKPVLGICLGAQLMAKALGAEVYKGKKGQEIGWYDIAVNDEGLKTPATHLNGMMFHWHGDTFDLPQGAKCLASSKKYENQIFSFGENALALQCHPEVTAQQLEHWYPGLDEKTAQEVKAGTKKHIAALNKKARAFLEEWLESVGL